MENAVFEFHDYKTYLHERIRHLPGKGRGARSQLAAAMGCQVAYVSHVLAGDRHFSLEQAEAAARFFSLRTEETEFFLLLVEYCRAGTHSLKEFLRRQLEQRRENFQQLKARVKLKGKISLEEQALYYSSWHFQAVQMALLLPHCGHAREVAKLLGLGGERVNEVISFLLSKGLVRETKNGFENTETKIHLGNDSPFVSKLHSNWRVHCLGVLDRKQEADLHYSGLVTVSRADYKKLRELFVKAVLDAHNLVFPSKDEMLCFMGMDFYEL